MPSDRCCIKTKKRMPHTKTVHPSKNKAFFFRSRLQVLNPFRKSSPVWKIPPAKPGGFLLPPSVFQHRAGLFLSLSCNKASSFMLVPLLAARSCPAGGFLMHSRPEIVKIFGVPRAPGPSRLSCQSPHAFQGPSPRRNRKHKIWPRPM